MALLSFSTRQRTARTLALAALFTGCALGLTQAAQGQSSGGAGDVILAACSYSVQATTPTLDHLGGTRTIKVTTGVGCVWTAATTAPWITITSGTQGIGTGNVTYSVTEVVGDVRDGIITVAGQNVAIHQNANPDFDKVKNYILGKGSLTSQELVLADVNFDRKIDVADLIAINNQMPVPSSAVHWISPVDGDWNLDSNWSTGHVPSSTDIVVIDTTQSVVTVTSSHDISVADLRMPGRFQLSRPADNLKIAGSRLTVTGPASIGGTFTMSDTASVAANLTATGTSARLAARDATLTNAAIQVTNGARVYLPGLLTYTWNIINTNPTLFDVEGTGSVLDLPNMISLSFNANSNTAYLFAGWTSGGGQINLPALTDIVTGPNDVVGLYTSNLGQINANALTTTSNLSLNPGANSTLTLPGLSGTLTKSTINVPTSGTLILPALSGLGANNSVTINGTFSAASLSSITDMSLTLSGTAAVTLPALTSYTSTNGSTVLALQSSGSSLTAAALATITNLRIALSGGATLSLPGVTQYTWNIINTNPTLFDVEGTGSVLNLANMATLSFNANSNTAYLFAGWTSGGGQLNLPALTSIVTGANDVVGLYTSNLGQINANALTTTSNLSLNPGANSTLTLPGLSGTLTKSTINVPVGGTLNLPALSGLGTGNTVTISGNFSAASLSSITDASLTLSGSAAVTLPALTSYTSTNGSTVLALQSSGSSLTAAALATITNLRIALSGGATLSLPGVTQYTWNIINTNPTLFDVEGTGSVLNLANMATLSFNANSNTAYLFAGWTSGGGQLNLPALTSIVTGANDVVGLYTSNLGQINANALTTTSNLSLNPGANSTLTLPGLSGTLTKSTINVPVGGTLTLPALSGLGTGNTVTISGNFSAASLSSITDASLTLSGTTAVTLPALTSYTSTNGSTVLALQSSGSSLTAAALATITNLRIALSGGATLSLPGVTQYTWNIINTNPTLFDVEGTGSVLNLANMATLSFNANSNTAYLFAGWTSGGGQLNLPALTSIVTGANDVVGLYTSNLGQINANALTTTSNLSLNPGANSTLTLPGLSGTLTKSTINVPAGGTLTLPALSGLGANNSVTINGTFSAASLTSITDASLTLSGSAAVTLPALTSYTSTNGSTVLALQSSGSSLTAAALATITNLRIALSGGATLSLPGVTQYTWNIINTNPTLFDVEGTGSVLNLANMATLSFNANSNTAYLFAGWTSGGGQLNLPALTSIVTGANDVVGLYTSNLGQINANALTTTSNLSLNPGANSTLTLPGLSGTLTKSTINVPVGGTLTLPALSGLGTGNTVTISGNFSAASLSSITRGAGSTPTIMLQSNALVTLPALTTITDVNFTLSGTAALNMPALTSYTSTDGTAQLALQSSGCSLTAAALATITNLKINLSTGGTLALPGVHSYTFNANASPNLFIINGSGSALSLANLTALTFTPGVSGNAAAVYAQAGGHVSAASLASVTLGSGNTLSFNSDGAGSVITITALTPLPTGVTKNATNSGVIN